MASPIPRSTSTISLAGLLFVLAPAPARAAGPTVLLAEAEGEVRAKAPDKEAKDFVAVVKGAQLVDGTRLKTGPAGEAKLSFPDGSEVRVKPASEIIVRASSDPKQKSNGLVLFLGRAWSKVVKSGGGETTFEVRSANAVAGVRGTDFEVGVALDGSARVVVKEGEVAVDGDGEEHAPVRGGQEVESSHQGRLDKVKPVPEKVDWDGWFSARAKKMEKAGLEVARELSGRLNRRKDKLERLVKEQRGLRKEIEALEAQRKRGSDVDGALRGKLAQLEKTTARLEDMKTRLQGAFGLFEKWGAVAKGGGIADGEAIGRLSSDIQKVAADFADMIEEGTDLSQEGMDDMMKDMQKGKRDTPKKNAGDELFR